MNNFKSSVIALTCYTILTIVLTYPLILNVTQKVPGHYDVWSYLWNLWWLKKSILLHTNPYHTDYIFHPTGTGLGLHTLGMFNSLSGILLQQFFSLVTTYNIIVLLSFVVSAYGVYLLVYHLTKDKRASFFSGIVFAFSPYRFLELEVGHLNLVSTEWIPFYILYLMKLLEEGGRKNTLLTSLFLLLVSLSSWQYMGFMLIFTAFYILYTSWFNNLSLRKLLVKAIPSMLVFSLMVLPFMYPLVLEPVNEFDLGSKLGVAAYYSADVLSFFLPNSLHPLLGKFSVTLSGRMKSAGGLGTILALGYTTLLLALYQLSTEVGQNYREKINKSLKNRETRVKVISVLLLFALLYPIFRANWIYYFFSVIFVLSSLSIYNLLKEKRIGLWGASFLFFLLLSLGPFLHILGRPTLLLPYLLLYLLPGFTLFRVPARFVVMAMLSLAILSGTGLKNILEKTKKKNLVTVVVTSLVLFEFLSVPIQLSSTNVPDIYNRLSKDSEDYAILEVPISPIRFGSNESLWETGLPEYMYYQTVHEKKIVGGYVSYPSDYARSFIGNNALFHRLNNPYENASDEKLFVKETLEKYNIRYVIIHKDILNSMFPGTFNPINGLFNKTLSLVYEDERVIVYTYNSTIP